MENAKSRLLVVDGNSIMNRAFYGVRPLTNSAGLHTNAVYGYVNILKKHLDSLSPDLAAVAFDVHAPTFRHRMFDGYKANRHPMPEELREQVPYVKEVTALLGFTLIEKEGWEADDVLGTLSREGEENGAEVFIVTGDRDSLQLVSENVTVILASTGADVEYTPEVFREKYGVEPQKLVDVKAIMGDASDNIPGVKGIGEKGALSLIAHFGSLREVYLNLDSDFIKPAMREKLAASREDANLSFRLAAIDRRVPGLGKLDGLARRPYDVPGLKKLFSSLEFTRLIGQFAPAAPSAPADGARQLSLDDLPPEEAGPARVTETLPTKALKKLLADRDFCFFAGRERAFSLDGALYTCDDPLSVVSDPALNRRMAVYDLKQLCHLCAAEGKSAPDAAFDAMLAAYLVNPSENISLQSLLWVYAQTSADQARLGDADFMLSRLERLRAALSERVAALGMGELYRGIELPLARTLAGMEQVGFAVDRAGLEAYGAELKKNISVMEKEIKELCGSDFNVNSPKQLGKVLFEDLGLPAPKKTKSGYTTDAQTLEKLADLHPVIALILEYRALTKLNGTYAEGLVKAIDPEDGRIHTRFNQTQTATGRLSSLEPNLQNIPVRTPLGRELRRFFTAKEGCLLVDADYSQIELRLLAHLSGDEALIRAFENGEDIHRRTAARVFGVPFESVTDQMRKAAKAINFGIIYGMGAFSLAQDIKVSRAEAARYIEEYFASYPRVKSYLEGLIDDAKANGFVTTMFGRRRYVPELSAARKNLAAFGERVARNTPIQGTAADIIKLAMVHVDRRLKEEGMKTRLILQVHDELILEAPVGESSRAAQVLSEEMENAVKLKVRLAADTRVGKTWFDCH